MSLKSVACVISIISDSLEVVHLNKCIYKRFCYILQLPYCVSVLLLTSGCKSAAVQYKHRYHLAPPPSILTKQIQTKLMLCKPLFIVHGRVKTFLKAMLQYKNEVPPLKKWVWHMHNEIVVINAKLQVSVQILLYNKK